MKIVYIVADGFQEYNSSRWRVSNLVVPLMQAGVEVDILYYTHWLNNDPVCKYSCRDADLIVIQRVMTTESISSVLYWRNQGKAVSLDFDDSYPHVDKDNPAYEFWIEGKARVTNANGTKHVFLKDHPLKTLESGAKHLSAITVPSLVLKEDWSRYGKTYYLPNYIDSSNYPKKQFPAGRKKLVVGWGGSMGHIKSFEDSGVTPALKKLIKEGIITFRLIGDKRIAERLEIECEFFPYVTYKDWAVVLQSFDIGIAPLAGEFDKRRSSIKLIEYTTAGIPFVASDLRVYDDFKEVDSGHVISNSKINWYDNIKRVADEYGSYYAAAQENIEFGKRYDAEERIDDVIKLYKEIIKL